VINKRPDPFTSDHVWVHDCSTCLFDHHLEKYNRKQPHCQKCGIDRRRAEERSQDIDVEACPVREVAQCRKCGETHPIGTDSPTDYTLCRSCLYPDIPTYHTVAEALKAMSDINAGKPPDPPEPPQTKDNRGSN